jgi:hypothetical protein
VWNPHSLATVGQSRQTFGIVPVHPVAQGLPVHSAGLGCPRPIIRHRRSNRWRDDGSSSNTSAKASIRRAALASRLFPAAPRNSPAVKSRRVISIPDIAPSPLMEGYRFRERTAWESPRVTSTNRWYQTFLKKKLRLDVTSETVEGRGRVYRIG